MRKRDPWTANADPRRSKKPAVRKKIEIIDAPVLRESVKGTAPTIAARGPLADDLRDLLPPLDPAVRGRVVDALADIALAELDGGSTPDVGKE
jgi:hypothetical protein